MPTSGDLVASLPADFEVFGQAVDTSLVDLKGGTTGQVLKKNTNADMDFVWSADAAGMTNPMTTTGDVIYSSSGSTPDRLGIGSTGNVLTVAGGVPTWAAPAATGKNFTLLNTGGTTLSGSTTTVSGISGIDQLFISIQSADSNSTSEKWGIRLNGVTSGYVNVANDLEWGSTYSAANYQTATATQIYIELGKWSGSSGSLSSGGIMINGCSTSGYKTYLGFGGGRPDGNDGHKSIVTGNVVNTTAITSVSAYAAGGTFTGGTMFIYGAV